MQQKSNNNSGGITGNPLEQLRYKKVVVRAMGLTYTGQLLGADDDSLFLKTMMRYVSLPMAQVSSIRAADEKEKTSKSKHIPKNFYLDPSLDAEVNLKENFSPNAQQDINSEKDKPGEYARPSSSDKDEA